MRIYTSKDFNFSGDMIEAELIAFIAVRSLKNMPYTFPTTTGVKQASSGGKIYKC